MFVKSHCLFCCIRTRFSACIDEIVRQCDQI